MASSDAAATEPFKNCLLLFIIPPIELKVGVACEYFKGEEIVVKRGRRCQDDPDNNKVDFWLLGIIVICKH